MGDLFSEAAGRRLGRVGAARAAAAADDARRVRRPGARDRAGPRAAARDRAGPRAVARSSTGRPGSGKTTLARIVAQTTGAEFEELSAVSATVANVREVLARARERLGASGRRTILFLDEIHRFNKAQQDALLPGVEEGLVTLIGATTENPYFELNSALLSRTQIYELEPHSVETAARASCGAAPRSSASSVAPEVEELIAAPRRRRRAQRARHPRAVGRRRRAPRASTLEERHVEDAARKRPLAYDKGGDAHYDFISAWIKSTRASDVQASVYYLAAMLEGGEDARFIARRMIVLASEDIGNADPQALLVAVAAAQAVEHVGLPEARLNLAQAAVYLARAPKSNASYVALERGDRTTSASAGTCCPPARAALGRLPGRAASSAAARATSTRTTTRPGFEVDCLPDELQGPVYYEPSGTATSSVERRTAGCVEVTGSENRGRRAR